MTLAQPDTEDLINRVQAGDDDARQRLLVRHQDRLRRMVSLRLDRRVAARVDAGDIVQEALIDADRKLPAYLQERPLPFYPWLRQLAWERLVKAHRRHLRADMRDAGREEPGVLALPDESAVELARRLIDSGTGPSQVAVREEQRVQVQAALARLREPDREVLVLRFLEQMSVSEIAAALGIREGAVKVRQVRALERLRTYLNEELGE